VVLVDASIIFTIDPARVTDVHIMWQDQYVNNLVRPQARGVIREAVSQFRVEEVYSIKRTELNQQLNQKMSDKLEQGGLLLVDFVLRNITFSDEYAQSVEQKQIAEQKAQEAAFVVDQRKQEAEQVRQTAQGAADAAVLEAEGKAKSWVIAANAEAEALVIQANAAAEARLIQAKAEQQALQLIAAALAANPDLLNYEYIQKLGPGIQVMLVPNDNPYLLPLPSLMGDETTEATILPTPSTVITDTAP